MQEASKYPPVGIGIVTVPAREPMLPATAMPVGVAEKVPPVGSETLPTILPHLALL